MPKFKLFVEQFVQEIGTVYIEADTPEAAVKDYLDNQIDFDVEWEDGVAENRDHSVSCVRHDSAIVWER